MNRVLAAHHAHFAAKYLRRVPLEPNRGERKNHEQIESLLHRAIEPLKQRSSYLFNDSMTQSPDGSILLVLTLLYARPFGAAHALALDGRVFEPRSSSIFSQTFSTASAMSSVSFFEPRKMWCGSQTDSS